GGLYRHRLDRGAYCPSVPKPERDASRIRFVQDVRGNHLDRKRRSEGGGPAFRIGGGRRQRRARRPDAVGGEQRLARLLIEGGAPMRQRVGDQGVRGAGLRVHRGSCENVLVNSWSARSASGAP